MDPDACLREIMELLEQAQDRDIEDTEDIDRDALVERLYALARWIHNGGFLPQPIH